VPDVGVEPTRQ